MSEQHLASLQATTTLIGIAICGFVFIGIMAMAIIASHYGKKGE
jgi:Na+-driven multidrug efflux pump